MKAKTIEAKGKTKEGVEVSGAVEVQWPETDEEALEVYGLPALASVALAKFVIRIQDMLRNGLKAGEPIDKLQEKLGNLKMGEALPRKRSKKAPTKVSVLGDLETLSSEERKEIMAELKKKLGK